MWPCLICGHVHDGKRRLVKDSKPGIVCMVGKLAPQMQARSRPNGLVATRTPAVGGDFAFARPIVVLDLHAPHKRDWMEFALLPRLHRSQAAKHREVFGMGTNVDRTQLRQIHDGAHLDTNTAHHPRLGQCRQALSVTTLRPPNLQRQNVRQVRTQHEMPSL